MLPLSEQAALARSELVLGWHRGVPPSLDELLARYPLIAEHADALVDLIHLEAVMRRAHGTALSLEEWLTRYPAHRDLLAQRLLLDQTVLELPRADPPAGRGATDLSPTLARQEEATLSSGLPSIPGYEVLEEIGRGGMAVVYRARHLALDRLVAVKMILAGGQAHAADLERFRLEAQSLALLQHANIVQIHEIGTVDPGSGTACPYLSLELCSGGTLAQRLGQPRPAATSAALILKLARAVQAAHEKGIIHRDLKPGNVLFTEDGVLKVGDFGLARRMDVESGKTRTGAVLGTPEYMAPEQAAGRTDAIGPGTDVYALGVILYECLTGRPPFKAANVLETLALVLEQEPAAPRSLVPGIPSDVETICLKCLHKDPEDRYVSAAELADDLERFLQDEPIRARPPSTLRRLDRWIRRHPGLVVAWGIAALLAILVVNLPDLFGPQLFGLDGLPPAVLTFLVLPTVPLLVAPAYRTSATGAVIAGLALGAGLVALLVVRSEGPIRWIWQSAALVGMAALLAGILVRHGWREALAWFVVLLGAAGLGWLLGDPWAVAAACWHALLLGLLGRFVAWSLERPSAGIALGSLLGGLVAGVLAELYAQDLPDLLDPVGLGRWPPALIALHLEVCLVYLGALAGGLLGPRSSRLASGDQVVPSVNITISTSTS